VPTAGWAPGDYMIRLDGDNDAQQFVPLTVRTPSNTGRIVVINAVTTWQAYNRWGGYSLYDSPSGRKADRSRAVSFDRPYQSDTMAGAGDFLYFELPFVRFAEASGNALGYATDVDLHADPHLLDGARAVITLGHDEYRSAAMRNNVVHARDGGVNLAFLGGNEIYRHIRLDPTPLGTDRLETDYKSFTEDPASKTDPLAATQEWRSPPPPGRKARSSATSTSATPSARTWWWPTPATGCCTESSPTARNWPAWSATSTPRSAWACPPPSAGGAVPLPADLPAPPGLRRRHLLHRTQRGRRVLCWHSVVDLRSGPGLHKARCRRTRRRAHDQRHHHLPPRRLRPGPRRRAASGSAQPATAPHPRCQRPDTRCAAQRSRTQLNPKRTLIPYRCSRLPRCSCRALFSVAYIAERDRPLMSISCAALYSPDS